MNNPESNLEHPIDQGKLYLCNLLKQGHFLLALDFVSNCYSINWQDQDVITALLAGAKLRQGHQEKLGAEIMFNRTEQELAIKGNIVIKLFKTEQFEEAYTELDNLIETFATLQNEAGSQKKTKTWQTIVAALLFIMENPAGLDNEFLEYYYKLPPTAKKELTQDRRLHEGAQKLMETLINRKSDKETIATIAKEFNQKNPISKRLKKKK